MHRIKEDALFLIDGSYLLYRSYYGLRLLQTSQGIPTQSIYGFCRSIKKLIDKFDPKRMALIWDSKGKTFRSEMFKEYKATRQAPPSDLFIQKDQIIEFADLINLKQISKTGYEADDLIGSIVHDYKNNQIIIVGPDKDLYQLLSEDVLIFDPFKDEIIDVQSFKKEKGFLPNKVSFFYSLLGDSSDNIPGVKGIGKKTASELVKKFDSLEDLYKNLDKVKNERIQELLKEKKEDAFLSFKLFSLKDYKLNFKENDFDFDKNNWVNAEQFFLKYEFSSLYKDLKKRFHDLPKNTKENQGVQLSLLDQEKPSNSEKVYKKKKNWKYHIILKQEDLDNLVSLLKKSKKFSFDTETTGLKPLQEKLVGFSFAVNKKESYYVPLDHNNVGKNDVLLEKEKVLEQLKPILENNKIKKILHNTKFDQLVLWSNKVEINNVTFDTLLAANLLRKNDGEKINLKILSLRYLDEPMQTFKDVLDKHKDFRNVPLKEAAEYGAYDALQTFKLKILLEKDLKKNKDIYKIFKNLEMPLSQVLFEMEREGIFLDVEKLRKVGKEVDEDLKVVERKIIAAIQHKLERKRILINLNSPKQIEKLLFEDLKLPMIKKSGKGNRSTDQEVLEQLGKIEPIAGMILNFRELAKIKSTYIESLIKEVNPNTKRIHTSFSQIMVATGRLASSNPNLQNIPATIDHGVKIRSAFEASYGKIFLSSDYSQVELRVLAHMTKDKNLTEAFLKNKDVHALTASQIFDIPIDKVSHKQRQIAKRINFSIIYGLTPFGLAKDLDIKPSEAKIYIDKYFEQYKGIANWIEKTIEKAKQDGFVETWLGRRRYVPNIRERNNVLFQAAKRVAINSPIQGTSAEIMKLAMININKELKRNKLEARMILQIHDELLIELPIKEQDSVEKIIKKEMEEIVKWEIPFKVTIRIGKNWGQVTK